jgi:hypothetical protein
VASALRAEAARALLDLGADANAYSDEDEATALMIACRDAATDLGAKRSALQSVQSASPSSSLEATLQVLLQGGAQPNLRGGARSGGKTAAHLLLENGLVDWADKMKALGVLLSHGARLDVPSCPKPTTTGAQLLAALIKGEDGGRELQAALDSTLSAAKSTWGVKKAGGSGGSGEASSSGKAAAKLPEAIVSRLLSKAAARPTIRPMAVAAAAAISASTSGGAGCCLLCGDAFNALTKRPQHCRLCGHQVCAACSGKKLPLGSAAGGGTNGEAARVCDGCFNWGSNQIAAALAASAARDQSKEGGFLGPEAVARARQRREEARAQQEAAEQKELLGGAASLGGRAMSWLMGEGGDEESRVRRQRQAAAARVTGQMEEVRVGLQQRGERIENLADRTNELVDSSAQFAAMARQLNESKGWGGLW